MVAGRQKYTVVEESCMRSRRLTGCCSITDNDEDAIMHNIYNTQCNTRDSHTVTDNLNALLLFRSISLIQFK
jgi:hypothetical protein